LDLVNGVEMCL